MPNYGPDCQNCSGEDCVCCGVYMEAKADAADERIAEMDFYDDWDYDNLYGEVNDRYPAEVWDNENDDWEYWDDYDFGSYELLE